MNEYYLTEETVDAYLKLKISQGVKPSVCKKYRASLKKLLDYCKDIPLSKEHLSAWRKSMEDDGYRKLTVQRHITVVNDFFRNMGLEQLCIGKPLRVDLTGRIFGYLTVIEPTEKRYRRDVVWRCICKCGKEVNVPASMLISGNTGSCGCIRKEIFDLSNRYVDGTSLRQAMADKPDSKRNSSGYTGVYPKRDKWRAVITYKGIRYYLGTYSNIEDAVKARRRAKEVVIEDATKLYKMTEQFYAEKLFSGNIQQRKEDL